jgi:hypothetical protein
VSPEVKIARTIESNEPQSLHVKKARSNKKEFETLTYQCYYNDEL